jgi:acylphosphatase
MAVAMRLRVHGRVQGVGYRAWTIRTAREFGLAGWVRNLTDNTVEILAIGPPAAVERLAAAAQAGPPGARVTAVNTTPEAPQPLTEFRQLATASPGSPA